MAPAWKPGPFFREGRIARLGLPHQRFHDLRHAFATLIIESGEDLGVVSRTLGHADPGHYRGRVRAPYAGHARSGR
jgi:integrase